MTPEQIQQAVASGALAPDTADYMLRQQAQMQSSMPPPPPAPPEPPPVPTAPPQWEPGQPWVPGVGTAQEDNEDWKPLGDRAEDAAPQNNGAGGRGAGGGMPWVPPQQMAGGASGPPPMAEMSQPPPPMPPPGPVDPAKLILNRPPPVQGTDKSAGLKPTATTAKKKGLPNPLPEYSKNTLANFDEQKKNLEARRDFDAANARMQSEQMGKDWDALNAQDQQRDMQHQHRLAKSEAALADLNARADALSRGKIDPGHWISDDPMHAIAAVFLGMDSPVIQKMIDRDISAQKEAYDRNKDSYLARASNYGHLRELYKDDAMAQAAARVMQIDRAQRKLNVMASQQQPQDINLKTQAAMTTLAQAREDADYRFKQMAYAAQTKGAAGAMPKVFNDIFKGNAEALRAAQQDYFKRNPEGNMLGFANEVSQANKGSLGKTGGGGGRSAGVFQNEVNAEAVEEAALQLKALHKEYGMLDPLTNPVKSAQMRAEMDKLQRMLAPAAARMVHGGAATKEEIEAEKEGMSGHWDPIGTRQASLDVVIADARRRKAKLSKGLQEGFSAATEGDEEEKKDER